MADSLHPQAAHNVPWFITPPGETDVLMTVTAAILLLAVVAFGVLYFRLHSLPEQIAHKSKRVQMEIVAVLGLIALFTHMHIFWIAALILAFIDLPDFGTPLQSIAGSVAKIAGVDEAEAAAEGDIAAQAKQEAEAARALPGARKGAKQADSPSTVPAIPATQAKKETSHA